MFIVYQKDNGRIVRQLPNTQNPLDFFARFPQEYRDNLKWINMEDVPNDLINYKVIEENLVLRVDEELEEIKKYRRILTEIERWELLLKPSDEEVQKAEETLKLLELLQEVM